ncbi:MAG: integrase arm-type DNA-binding domain-containing protein [Nitrospinae bacterium]|nr:integrase arm-type DNA-binding domain-containing protein [Nitrospinota bacterium]
MGKLTQTRIKSLKKEGMHGDGGGLYVNVSPNKTKSYVLYITIKGQGRRKYGLGGCGYTTLAEARKQAVEMRQAARAGIDPKPRAQAQTTRPTFKQAIGPACDWIADVKGWQGERKAKDWQGLNNRAVPRLGNLPLDAIRRADILSLIDPLWREEKHETAKKLLTAIKQVFAWGVEYGHIDHNPAEGIKARQPKEEKHLRSLEHGKVAAALKKIRNSRHQQAALCLEFMILTGVRSERGRAARWAEIDLDAKTWTLPASLMKKSKEDFVIPLSEAAVRVLELVKLTIGEGSEFIFPASRGGGYMADTNIKLLLKESGLFADTCIHGFRSSLRTWGREAIKAREDVLELTLSHKLAGALKRSYQRSDLFEERAELLEAWSAYIGA